MLQDLRQQWKERDIRRSYLAKASDKEVHTINFVDYQRSSTRNEMPNKYNRASVPKIEIETVYEILKRKPDNPSLETRHQSLKPNEAELATNSQKPFYYIENNEISSVDQFLQIYKNVLSNRKKQQKLDMVNSLEDKRRKIETTHTFTPRYLAKSSVFQDNQCQSVRTSRTVQLERVASAKDPQKKTVMMTEPATTCTSFRPTPFGQNQLGKTVSDLQIPTGENYPQEGSFENEDLTGRTRMQKFTKKEIVNHFNQIAISPKAMRNTKTFSHKERYYTSMFKSPKTMDYTIENTIKKVTKLTEKDLTSHQDVSEKLKLSLSLSKSKSARLNQQDISELGRNLDEIEILGEETARKIQRNLKNLKQILNSSPSVPLATTTPIEQNEKKFQVRVKNKLPLRSKIAEKYKLKEKLENYQLVNMKMKEATKRLNIKGN